MRQGEASPLPISSFGSRCRAPERQGRRRKPRATGAKPPKETVGQALAILSHRPQHVPCCGGYLREKMQFSQKTLGKLLVLFIAMLISVIVLNLWFNSIWTRRMFFGRVDPISAYRCRFTVDRHWQWKENLTGPAVTSATCLDD